jgi:glutamyl-tRNA reductase
VAQAEAIIETRVRDFDAWIRNRAAVPVIQGLRNRAETLSAHEIERAKKLLARGESPEAVIEQLAQALTNKFLHAPVSALHQFAGQDEASRAQLVALLSRFYSHPEH